MEEDFYSRMSERASVHKGGRTRFVLGAVLAAFLLGAGVTSLIAWKGLLPGGWGSSEAPAGVSSVPLDLASPAPSASAGVQAAAKDAQRAVAKVAQQQGGLEARVVAMEQRLTQLDLQAQAASGNVARAEGLLVAFAARRAIERGAPLGYLEDQLKLRFAGAQSQAVKDAVKAVLAAADNPVTLDKLQERMEDLGPKMVDSPKEESGWEAFKRELGGLFIIRKSTTPSPDPERRLERVKGDLATGKVESAIKEVEMMPGANEAAQWIADAKRYVAAREALDLLENFAITAKNDMRSGGR